MSFDFEWCMAEAISEAKQAMGRTHPNPAVGAVVLHEGKIVARGRTSPPGGNHAEVNALNKFKETGCIANDSTYLFVTMEPCSTYGRTPPCTEAIIASGISHVAVGAKDPNPLHSGKGFELLSAQGIHVKQGLLEDQCDDLNMIFNHVMLHQTPFISAKIATTLDGRIATRGGISKWITSSESRQDVMKWRRYFPAIGVGATTVQMDNPELTSRIEGEPVWCPIRFVFDRNLITFKDEIPRVYCDQFKDKTIVITLDSRQEEAEVLESKYGVQFWFLRSIGGLSLINDFRRKCMDKDIHGIYLEGGAKLLSTFLEEKELDYLFAYRAPKILADSEGLAPFFGKEPKSITEAIKLTKVKHEIFNADQLMRGYFAY